eukprot:c28575_g2_i6 orf=190-2274(-)
MDFKEDPYNVLCKMFPQVDSRIIKATVLDLGEDLQSAIEFLVDEVIGCGLVGCNEGDYNLDALPPSISTNELKYNRNELIDIDYNENEEAIVWLSGIGTLKSVNVNGLSSSRDGSAIGIPHPDKVEQMHPLYTVKDSSTMLRNGVACSPRSKCSSHFPHTHVEPIGDKQEIGGMPDSIFLRPVNMSSSTEDDICSPSVSLVNQDFAMNPNGSQLDSTTLMEKVNCISGKSSSVSIIACVGPGQDASPSVLSKCCFQPPEETDHSVDDIVLKVYSQEEDILETQAQISEHLNNAFSSGPLYGSNIPLSTSCEDGRTCGTMTRSSNYNANMEGLDAFVHEARGDKEIIKIAIEDTKALWRKTHEAELLTQQAKIDVAKGGLDTMKKVEEMRQLLAQAQAANEVIQDDLQARYKSAVLERQAAEEERERKEASARNVLAMQERLIATIAQESRDLEEEAQVCTKLREFLIDRGQIVDSLQGEMAVLCEDVEILQKQIEGGVFSMSSGYLSMSNIPLQVSLEGPYNLIKSNRSNASSSGGFPDMVSGEVQIHVESSGYHHLSAATGKLIDGSSNSGSRSLKSVCSRCLNCHGSNGSGSGHCMPGLDGSIDNISSDRTSLLESAKVGAQCVEDSVLVTEHLSSDGNNAKNDYFNIHREVFPVGFEPCDLNKDNMNMFRSPNLSNKGSSSDDDGWHMLDK